MLDILNHWSKHILQIPKPPKSDTSGISYKAHQTYPMLANDCTPNIVRCYFFNRLSFLSVLLESNRKKGERDLLYVASHPK